MDMDKYDTFAKHAYDESQLQENNESRYSIVHARLNLLDLVAKV